MSINEESELDELSWKKKKQSKPMPIEKTHGYARPEYKLERERAERACNRLHKQCRKAELAEVQGKAWKTKLADDLNTILARAQYHLEQDADESDIAFARAVLRVVGRVAEFEGIRRTGK